MLGLLRRDPAVRALPRWLAVSALTASLFEGARTALTLRAVRDGANAETFVLLLLALWIPLICYLAFGRIGQRCTEFDQVLPIAARRLWSVHVVGTTAGTLAVLAVAAGVVWLHDRLVGSLPGNPPLPQPGVDRVAIPLAAGSILALALLHHVQPALRRIHAGTGYALVIVAAALGILALAVALDADARGWALLPLAVALVLGVRAYFAVPAGFTSVPLQAARSDAPIAHPGRERPGTQAVEVSRIAPRYRANRPPSRWRSLRTAWRILYRGIAPGQLVKVSVVVWLGLPTLFVWGLFIAGLFIEYEAIQFTNVVLSAYLLFAFLPGPMAPLHTVDPLPISRKLLCCFLILPLSAVFGLGYGAGRLGKAAFKDPAARIEFQAADSRLSPPYPSEAPTVRVPVEHFEIAWDGAPPESGSPWGETHPAWSIPLYAGSRAVLYSPFNTPADSSPEFIALQISRAIEAVYGTSVSPDQITRRYLEIDGAQNVDWKDGGAALRERLVQLPPRLRLPIFPVVFALVGLLFMTFATLYIQAFRAAVTDRMRLIVYFSILAVAMVVHLAPLISMLTGFAKDWVLAGLMKLFIRWLVVTLPAGGLSVWVICLLLLLGGYWVVQSRFKRIEAPLPRAKSGA